MERLRAPLRALVHAQFRRYWLGSVAYASAVRLVMLGQGWLVFELSRSALDLGLLGAAMALPAVLVTWTGGALADRLDKRKLLMTTAVITTGLLMVQAVLDLSGVVAVWQVITIAVLLGLVGGLEWPAMQAIVPSLVERHHLMSAVSLNAIVWQGTRMVVPALGGVAIAIWDTTVVFVAAGAGSLYMLAALARLEIGSIVKTRHPVGNDFAEVVRFILREKLFAVLIPLAWTVAFFISSFLHLMPVFADLLGTGGGGFGALMSASGMGSVLGTLLVGGFQSARRLGWMMLTSMFLSGLCLSAFSLITGFAELTPGAFPASLLCVALVSMFASVFMVTSMTVLQLHVPEALRGRVMGIHGIAFNLMPLGALFTGAIAAFIGAAAAVAVGAFIVMLASVGVLMSQREVREFDGRADARSGPGVSTRG